MRAMVKRRRHLEGARRCVDSLDGRKVSLRDVEGSRIRDDEGWMTVGMGSEDKCGVKQEGRMLVVRERMLLMKRTEGTGHALVGGRRDVIAAGGGGESEREWGRGITAIGGR